MYEVDLSIYLYTRSTLYRVAVSIMQHSNGATFYRGFVTLCEHFQFTLSFLSAPATICLYMCRVCEAGRVEDSLLPHETNGMKSSVQFCSVLFCSKQLKAR